MSEITPAKVKKRIKELTEIIKNIPDPENFDVRKLADDIFPIALNLYHPFFNHRRFGFRCIENGKTIRRHEFVIKQGDYPKDTGFSPFS